MTPYDPRVPRDLSAEEVADWLLLLTFDRVRYVEGQGWEVRKSEADPWRTPTIADAEIPAAALKALGRSPETRDVYASICHRATLAEALDLLARESHVFVPAPASSTAPGVLVDLAAARRRRLARAS